LKDGTKIVGHMTAVSTDKIEVATSCGKVQPNRGDIVTISFPENSRANESAPTPAELEAPKNDETLNGVRYTMTAVMNWRRPTSCPQSLAAVEEW
jgi:hypothetical protein